MANDPDSKQAVKRGLQFVSEAAIPGGSNLINGDFKQAAIYAVAGIVARALFGLPGVLAVAANSFTKARTGLSLLDHLNAPDDRPAAAKK